MWLVLSWLVGEFSTTPVPDAAANRRTHRCLRKRIAVKTFDLTDNEGRILAFEIDNCRINRRSVCDVIRSIPGVTIRREPKRWWISLEEEFCEFDLDGVRFVAWEPFGDNSRYWIGPKPPRWVPQIETIRCAFQACSG